MIAGRWRGLRARWHVAGSAARAWLRPEAVGTPRAAHLLVTWRCNLRCRDCPSWRTPGAELDLAGWRRVLRELRGLDVVKVLGGEPFVRADATDLLRLVRAVVDPALLQVTTNGMLTERVLDGVRAVAGPGLQVRVSLDGLPATHDRQRGVAGGHARVLETLRGLARLRDAGPGFDLGLNVAITDESLDDLPALRALAEELGAKLVPGFLVSPFLVSPTLPEVTRPRVVRLTRREEAARALAAEGGGVVGSLASRGLRRQLADEVRPFGCRELRELAYVLPSGDVVRCGMDHRPVGNLAHQDLATVWASPAAREARARVDACPGCHQASIEILSRLYGGCRR